MSLMTLRAKDLERRYKRLEEKYFKKNIV